jgi:hypothetical protein
LVCGHLQEFFGTGVALGFTVLFHILLVLVGSSEGAGSTQKFMREFGFMVDDLEGR